MIMWKEGSHNEDGEETGKITSGIRCFKTLRKDFPVSDVGVQLLIGLPEKQACLSVSL